MGRTSKTEERKREILQGCYDVINREGLESATLKKIGKERRIAPSLVSHYYNKKEEMIAELVDFTFEKESKALMPYLEEGDSPEKKLKLYIEKMVTLYLEQNVVDNVFYSCFYRSLFNESIHDKFKDIYDHKKSLLGNLIKSIKEENKESSLDIEELVLLINVFIEGVNFMHVIQGDNKKFKRITERFSWFIEQMLLEKQV